MKTQPQETLTMEQPLASIASSVQTGSSEAAGIPIENREAEVAASSQHPEAASGHGLKMMLGMAVCCGAPILAVAAISALGLGTGALNTLVALACPIGMGVMMIFMSRRPRGESEHSQTAHHAGHACCAPMGSKTTKATQNPDNRSHS